MLSTNWLAKCCWEMAGYRLRVENGLSNVVRISYMDGDEPKWLGHCKELRDV
jgi:hypothetical protein